MLVPVSCTCCKARHFDHYECSVCQTQFGSSQPDAHYWGVNSRLFKFCPMCGTSLYNENSATLDYDLDTKHLIDQGKAKKIIVAVTKHSTLVEIHGDTVLGDRFLELNPGHINQPSTLVITKGE